jgi:hypothetical protein
MADFKTALTKGLSAALEAERRRNEVKQILDDLNFQVYEATNRKIIISIESININAITAILLGDKNTQQFTLTAFSTDENTRKRVLCSWRQANEGYPCTLTIGKNIYSCEDKQALENCLTELLQDAEVGEKIHALMQPDAV